MTTLADKCKEWWPGMCGAGFSLTDSLTATQIYNGVTRPDFWIAVYAFVELEAEADGAKQLMLEVLQDAALLHEAGDLKTRIAAMDIGDDASTLEANRLWARNLKASTPPPHNHLLCAYLDMTKWLKDPRPKGIQIPFEHVVAYKMAAQSTSMQTARLAVYGFMRGLVPESVFKGAYT